MRHSCGVILYRDVPTGAREYLLQCRKDTIPYLVFLQGRHDGTTEGVLKLWRGMTTEEHQRLRTLPFRTLFERANIHRQCWDSGQRMFLRSFSLLSNLDDATGWSTPEWGFPKGRKNHPEESSRDCALRELLEETGLHSDAIEIYDGPAIREAFRGTDDKMYTCDYYLARSAAGATDPTLHGPRPEDPEVSALAWCSVEDAKQRFRPWESYRCKTLDQAHLRLMSRSPSHVIQPSSK